MDFFGRDPHRLNNRTFGDKVGSRIESLGKLYIAIEYKPFLNHSTTSTGDSCVFPATAFVGHVGHWYYKKMQYVLSVAQLAQTQTAHMTNVAILKWHPLDMRSITVSLRLVM